MPTREKTKSRKEKGAYMGLYKSIMNSPQFRLLSPTETKVFIHLYAQYNGKNNGNLALPYNQVKDTYNLSRQTLSNALKGLVEKGWVEISRRGAQGKLTLCAVTIEAVDECLHPETRLPLHDLPPTKKASYKWKNYQPMKKNDRK